MSYRVEWWPAVLLAGLVLLLIPPVAMLAVVAVALAAVGAVIALAGAILALLYVIGRSLHRRWLGRRRPMETPEAIGNVANHPHAKILGPDMTVAHSTADELAADRPVVGA